MEFIHKKCPEFLNQLKARAKKATSTNKQSDL